MQTQCSSKAGLQEQASYFEVPGAHLYTVLHPVMDPVARVLLVGPFAAERHFSYHPWVRWARFLAATQIEVLRFDYRGVGESTGVFEDLNFENWGEDVRLLAGWFATRSPRLPLLLHGLELGAILAGKCFQAGVGDALLLWAPPTHANQVLRSTLLRWSGLEQLYESPENRISASEFCQFSSSDRRGGRLPVRRRGSVNSITVKYVLRLAVRRNQVILKSIDDADYTFSNCVG